MGRGKGIRKYSPKDRRRMRRINHVAKDLGTPKYKQRIIPKKNRKRQWDDSYE